MQASQRPTPRLSQAHGIDGQSGAAGRVKQQSWTRRQSLPLIGEVLRSTDEVLEYKR